VLTRGRIVEAGLRILDAWGLGDLTMRRVADELGASPAQVALAWLLAKGDDVVPIPGTTSPRHLAADLAARDVRLTADQRERLENVVASGPRYFDGGSALR